ncbi:MAG: hypothetical protein WDM81_12280 [Rhizomicrobium sp.]
MHSAKATFAQVAVAVRDWRAMTARLRESIDGLKANPPKVSQEEFDESIALLEWLGANHFTFLGARDYDFDPAGDGALVPVAHSGLGVLSDPDARVIRRGPDRAALTPQVRAFLTQPSPLIITKSNERSLVHRRVHMDYVGVKTFGADGKLTGERRFVGLFTSGAYSRRPSDIPLLRRKVANVLAHAGLPPASHDGKATGAYPRHLSARRAVPDLGRRPVRDRAGYPAARRAPDSARLPALRPFRPLRLRPRLRAARPLRHPMRANASTRSWPRR